MKILAVVDNTGWCWTNTVKDIKHHLPECDIKVMTADDFRNNKDNLPQVDFIWFRGYSNLFISQRDIDMLPPFIWTMSTGGKRLLHRIQSAEGTGKHAKGVIVQCKQAYHEMALQGYNGLYLIPNGVNTRLFKPSIMQKELIIGLAANVYGSRSNLKGVTFIQDAVNKLQATIVQCDTDNRLTHEQMPTFYQGLRYYVQPSESEGCSNSVMEAMACGIPCLICDNVGYHGEVCKDGIDHKAGQVVFVKRNAGDIAKKIRILEENPYLYKRIASNARKFAIQHDWKGIAAKYKDAFIDVMRVKNDKPRIATRIEVPESQEACSGVRYWVTPVKTFRISGRLFKMGRRDIVTESTLKDIRNMVRDVMEAK